MGGVGHAHQVGVVQAAEHHPVPKLSQADHVVGWLKVGRAGVHVILAARGQHSATRPGVGGRGQGGKLFDAPLELPGAGEDVDAPLGDAVRATRNRSQVGNGHRRSALNVDRGRVRVGCGLLDAANEGIDVDAILKGAVANNASGQRHRAARRRDAKAHGCRWVWRRSQGGAVEVARGAAARDVGPLGGVFGQHGPGEVKVVSRSDPIGRVAQGVAAPAVDALDLAGNPGERVDRGRRLDAAHVAVAGVHVGHANPDASAQLLGVDLVVASDEALGVENLGHQTGSTRRLTRRTGP